MTDSPADLFTGDRVVVRYLMGAATPADWRGDPAAARSDVTGILVDDGDPLVLRRDDALESIPRSSITSVRLLSARPVRNSEIRAIEEAGARSLPGLESEWVAGWLARAGGGLTPRANSALPLDRSARFDDHSRNALAQWYAQRGLPLLLAIPDRLLPTPPHAPADTEEQVLTTDLDAGTASSPTPAPVDVELRPQPTDAWLQATGTPHDQLPLMRQIVCAGADQVIFAQIGEAAEAIGRATLTLTADGARLLELTDLRCDPARRRQGLASAIVARLLDWGVEHDADRAVVRVATADRPTGAWLRRLGFGVHHTFGYLHPTTEVPAP